MRSGKASLMERVAAFIVDKRNIIFLIYIAAAVFCIFSSGWVEVSDSLTKYLPESTETQIGLELMDDEFTTFGTARIVVENVSYEQAEKICADIERVPGVKEVAFDDSPEHYNEAAALFSVTFDGENDDEVSVLAMDTLRDMLSVYDLYVNTEVGNPLKAIINRELLIVDGIAALIIVVVLLFTSKTYAEIPVLLITFGAAALLNMGTNYMMGEISFVTWCCSWPWPSTTPSSSATGTWRSTKTRPRARRPSPRSVRPFRRSPPAASRPCPAFWR